MTLLGEYRWLTALRRGFLLLLPLTLVGGVALFLRHLPIPVFQTAMQTATDGAWFALLNAVFDASLGMLSLYLVLTTSYSLATLDACRPHAAPTLATAGVSLICYLLLHLRPGVGLGDSSLGAESVLSAALCSLAAAEMFLRLCRIKRLHVRLDGEADPLLPGMLSSLLPALLTVTCFGLLSMLLSLVLPHNWMGTLLVGMFQDIDSELGRALLFDLISQLLWFVGAHGNNILEVVNTQLFVPAAADNALAASFGDSPQHIITKTFFDTYVLLGGSGATAGLLIALLVHGRHHNMRKIGWLSAPASLININEPLVFGLPIVLNPVFLLPFIGLPLLLTLTAWFAIHTGLVPPTRQPVDWTTPMLINAWLATESWRGVLLQVFNLALAVAVYLPFLRLAEHRRLAANQAATQRTLGELQDLLRHAPQPITPRQDNIGRLARDILGDLSRDLASGAIHLVYQPRVDARGTIRSVEALLRWRHPLYGNIPPTAVIGLAEDAGRISELGNWVIAQACQQLAEWHAGGLHHLGLSINLSPLQLADPRLLPHLREVLRRHQLAANSVELEITETRHVGNDPQSEASMHALNELGVRLAMDDFGMGYSSLLYMRRFRIDTIKLDGSLTREADHNPVCQDIVAYVALLCRSRDMHLVAEYIERPAQLAILHELGCHEFQGYLFSPPLPAAACHAFILQHLGSPSPVAPAPSTPLTLTVH